MTKQDLQIFGKRAKKDITKEITQLHGITTFIPIDPGSLAKEQHSSAITHIIFLGENKW